MISQSKPLDVVGMFRANVIFDKLTSVKEFYAVNCLNQPLLGWPTIKLLMYFQSVIQRNISYRFLRIGFHRKMKNPYIITEKPKAKGFYVATPRSISIPLQKAIIAELKNMEAN